MKYISGVIAVIAIVVAVLAYTKPAVVSQVVGAVTGPDVFSFTHFYDNVNIGGQDFATSSVGAVTYTATSIVKSRVIEHQAASVVTATLPTNAQLSAAGYLPNVGDTQVFFVQASTSAVTLAGATGVSLASASSTKVIASGRVGRVECVRMGVTEARLIQCFLTVGGN